MKNRHEPLPLHEFTSRFPLVENSAASAARLCLGKGREHLVEEIVNDVLLALWRCQRANDLPDEPEKWAYKVAWRRALRLGKVESRYAAGLLEQPEDHSEGYTGYMLMPPDLQTPVTGAELSDRLAAVKKLLDAFDFAAKTQLNGSETLLFHLLYRKRLTGDKAADQLGISPEALRKQWSRLLNKVLSSVRLQLQRDPLCNELLGEILSNEKTFRRTLLQFLRLVMQKGVEELEKIVGTTLKN